MARPFEYTPEIVTEVCNRLAEGESLRSVCRSEHMPAESTVRNWALTDLNGFYAPYAKAREMQAEKWADEIIDISDDGSNDFMVREGKDVVDSEHISRSRLRVDARKWILSKVLPKKFGEKIVNEISGPDGAPIKITRIEIVPASADEGK